MPAFFTKIEKIKPVYDWTYKIVLLICKLLLIGDIFITAWSITGRYVPFISDPAWSEEVVLSFMCYMAMLSASLAIRRNAHIRMTTFDRYLPKTMVKVLDVIADIAVLTLALVMLIIGWKFCRGIGSKGFYISMPWLSRFWMYFPIPFAGAAMVIFELEVIFNHIKAFWNDEEEEEEVNA